MFLAYRTDHTGLELQHHKEDTVDMVFAYQPSRADRAQQRPTNDELRSLEGHELLLSCTPGLFPEPGLQGSVVTEMLEKTEAGGGNEIGPECEESTRRKGWSPRVPVW